MARCGAGLEAVWARSGCEIVAGGSVAGGVEDDRGVHEEQAKVSFDCIASRLLEKPAQETE